MYLFHTRSDWRSVNKVIARDCFAPKNFKDSYLKIFSLNLKIIFLSEDIYIVKN